MVSMPTWDLFIIMFFVVATGYGFILQREKATITLISTYVALVVTTVWGETIFSLLSGNTVLFNQIWFSSNVSLFTTKTALFGLFIVLLSLKGEYISSGSKSSSSGSPLWVFLYSFLNSGLILSSVISFMDEAARQSLLNSSRLADFVMRYHAWWVVLPAVLIIIAGFTRKSTESTTQT